MTEEQNGFKIPFGLLLLDGLGAILAGLGLAKMFGGIEVLPSSFYHESGWILILMGIVLMLPFMLHIFKQIRTRAEQKIVK